MYTDIYIYTPGAARASGEPETAATPATCQPCRHGGGADGTQQLPGAQFTCFTSTKVQILTPEGHTNYQERLRVLEEEGLKLRASNAALQVERA